eukprot:gene12431-26149_t
MTESVLSDSNFKLSFMFYDPENYENILDEKICKLKIEIDTFPLVCNSMSGIKLEINSSPRTNYRQKCRFGIMRQIDVVNNGNPDNNQGCNGVELHKSSTLALNIESSDEFCYVMWENGAPSVRVDKFPLASTLIYNVMPILLSFINSNTELSTGLRAVQFLSTLASDLIISLVYDQNIQESLKIILEELKLYISIHLEGIHSIDIIVRSKGKKFIIHKDFLHEEFQLEDGRTLKYIQVEDGFSNPNGHVNTLALNWICSAMRSIPAFKTTSTSTSTILSPLNSSTSTSTTNTPPSSCIATATVTSTSRADKTVETDTATTIHTDIIVLEDDETGNEGGDDHARDVITATANSTTSTTSTTAASSILIQKLKLMLLLVIFWNYTVATGITLRLLAVELNKSLCTAAEKNLQMNNINNVKILNCLSEKFANQILRKKKYFDEKGVEYNFHTVLVDPPRCGLDDVTCALIANYEMIIYVSCNPIALMRDLNK